MEVLARPSNKNKKIYFFIEFIKTDFHVNCYCYHVLLNNIIKKNIEGKTSMSLSIDHVVMTVKDINKSIYFYSNILNMEIN